jgi:hypothetical protein
VKELDEHVAFEQKQEPGFVFHEGVNRDHHWNDTFFVQSVHNFEKRSHDD